MRTKEAVVSAVLAAATENSELLNALSASGEAPSKYNSHLIHVQHLQDTLFEQEKQVRGLKEATESQFRTHKRYRDSRVRRFYYQATRMLAKFEAKATKEESEYFAALADQSRAEERQTEIKQTLELALEAQKPLEAQFKLHGSTHLRIDALYDSIFTGPTPGFAREDGRETAHYQAQRRNEGAKEHVLNARKAIRFLRQATKNCKTSQNLLKYAREEADNALFFFEDAITLIARSNTYITYALTSVGNAGDMLGPLPPVMLEAHRTCFGLLREAKVPTDEDLLQDRISTSIAISSETLDQAIAAIDVFLAQAMEVEQLKLANLKKTARELEDSRQALQEVRQGIFEQVAGFGEAAPAYSECCDRAASYCAVEEEPEESNADEEESLASPVRLAPVSRRWSQLPSYEQVQSARRHTISAQL